MSEEAPFDPETVVAVPEVPAVVVERLAAIKAEAEAEAAALAQAASDEDARVEKLVAAKAVCAAVCAPINDAIAASDDPREIAALDALEKELHEPHREQLDAAYREFAGQREGDINPAPPGVTNIESHATASVVAAATPPQD